MWYGFVSDGDAQSLSHGAPVPTAAPTLAPIVPMAVPTSSPVRLAPKPLPPSPVRLAPKPLPPKGSLSAALIWAKANHISTVFMIVPDYSRGHAIANEFSYAFRQNDGTLVAQELYPLGLADFSAYLTKAKAVAPNGLLVIVDRAQDVGPIDAQFRDAGIRIFYLVTSLTEGG